MIQTNGNVAAIGGSLTVGEFHRLLAAIHGLVTKQGYQEAILDFSECTATFPGPMLAICSQVSRLRQDGVQLGLVLPSNETLRRLFVNANWAHIIDPEKYPESVFRGLRQVPTTQFLTAGEQASAVNSIMNIILGSLTGFTRQDLAGR